jgi:phenylpropionate dioxygenase-like ring-hydroxylating dioxygenase large terminal subunit
MRNGRADEIAKLIEPGRVHRRVYTDPDLFDLEMERIFGRAWLFVGHTSQVPNPGDFITTDLGRQPVIMVRHRDGSVQVLLNRCTHRGAKVVNERRGHAPRLTCCYHGWTFDTDGRLVTVPVPEGCAENFDKEAFGLARAPRVGEYRGFVFASLAAKGSSFEDHIGPVKGNIDDLVDRAPDGTLALDAGMHRYVYNGNWKLQVENVLDSYHVPFGHASTVNKDGVQFARREGDQKGAMVVETEKKQTAASWKDRKSFIAGNGHGWTSNTSLDDGKRSSPAFDEYKKVLVEKVGAARANDILTPRLHNSLLYPNMSIMGLNIHVRVIKPIAVDRTEVTIYPIRLVGAPEAMNFGNIRLLNVTHSAASFVQTDDLESFVRAQKGLQSTMTDWVDISRGLGAEEPDRERNATRELATHEMVVRAQYKAWLGYMHEAA